MFYFLLNFTTIFIPKFILEERRLYFEGIGDVSLIKKKVKNLRITVKPFEGVIESVPGWISFRQAEDFLYEKKEWILKSKAKVKEIEGKYTIFDEDTAFKTGSHFLTFIHARSDKLRVVVSKGLIQVFCPSGSQGA